ncbi:probable fructose-2,6-bisphosphatase TIGAR A isoform X1 [Alosa sapidissima]|uniref:probable fructose-2,6-bisphosphatase TIGAR A isoform X1 n=1 Tax=Alosa sapidissima TaxID=34773 RepID=UPI001C08B678|nr:probable fructose-2,6-bisphosphatase TIGAR A isoform X1 [Alosa sapidissima]
MRLHGLGRRIPHSYGETQYNRDGMLQGQSIDSPLSEIGERQAEAAGIYLRDVKFTNAFVSDMQRARQTAEIILKNNNNSAGVQLMTDPLLKERSFGIVEGQPMDVMRSMAKAAGQLVPDFTPPQGETVEQVKLRFAEFLGSMLQQLMDEHRHQDSTQSMPVHVLVITHGAYMRVVVRYMVEDLHCSFHSGVDKSHIYSACPNTGIMRFIFNMKCNESSTPSDLQCLFVNQSDHITIELQ